MHGKVQRLMSVSLTNLPIIWSFMCEFKNVMIHNWTASHYTTAVCQDLTLLMLYWLVGMNHSDLTWLLIIFAKSRLWSSIFIMPLMQNTVNNKFSTACLVSAHETHIQPNLSICDLNVIKCVTNVLDVDQCQSE